MIRINKKDHYNESDLDDLIDKILDSHIISDDLPNVCPIIAIEAGKTKVAKRVKSLILKDGMRNVEAAIGLIESELNMTSD